MSENPENSSAALSAGPSAAWRQISRRAFVRSIVTAAVIALGIAVVRGLEAGMHATFDKPPAPLSRPLPLMKKELGSPVRYLATLPDEMMDPETVQTLGTTDYLVRRYTDQVMNEGAAGPTVNLNINYYATGSSTPHVPEICWAGTGRIEAPGSRETFEVKDVPRKDGRLVNLHMRLISFMPRKGDPTTSPTGEALYTNVAYVFQVNGDYVASPQEVTSHFWKASYKYAYHCKIEVTPMELLSGGAESRGNAGSQPAVAMVCTRERAKQIVSDFMRYVLPEVEECLPDPAILTAEVGAASSTAGKP